MRVTISKRVTTPGQEGFRVYVDSKYARHFSGENAELRAQKFKELIEDVGLDAAQLLTGKQSSGFRKESVIARRAIKEAQDAKEYSDAVKLEIKCNKLKSLWLQLDTKYPLADFITKILTL